MPWTIQLNTCLCYTCTDQNNKSAFRQTFQLTYIADLDKDLCKYLLALH